MPEKWKLLDLFSGIGGFSYAAQRVWGEQLEIVAFCEIDKFCWKVLHKHWPGIEIKEDIRDLSQQDFPVKTFQFSSYRFRIEIHPTRKNDLR